MTKFTIDYLGGNMFRGGHDFITNAVNCVGVMGAGVALAVRRDLGEDADAEYFACYKRACASGELALGKLQIWDFRPLVRHAVVNFPTMHVPGGTVNPSCLRASTARLRDRLVVATLDQPVSIGIPALGCGIGDFKFDDLIPIIRHGLDDIDDLHVTLYAPR